MNTVRIIFGWHNLCAELLWQPALAGDYYSPATALVTAALALVVAKQTPVNDSHNVRIALEQPRIAMRCNLNRS